VSSRRAKKATLAGSAAPGLRFNEPSTSGRPVRFRHACTRRYRVKAQRTSRFSSRRSPDWIKSKNPDAPAVKREAEEEWGG
jgi:hypothetical protein